jgi:multidrug efflux pump subunit AcrA (membrane-fusion protein)
MSTIGRVFIVINLVLAGAFVFIAGTFLQQHTDWKQRHDDKVAEAAVEKRTLEDQLAVARDRQQVADRELRSITDLLEKNERGLAETKQENDYFKTTLTEQGAKLSALTSHSTTMADAIARATADSKQALDLAMQATQEKQQALNEKEAAESSLSDARREIGDLESKIADQNDQIASLAQNSKEKDLLLEAIKIKIPGVLTSGFAQPSLRGVVDQASASSKICTVRITHNPAEAEIKPGYTLAIYRDGTYKAEALITEVQGDMVFCTVTKMVDGASVSAGDAAATNPAGM